MPEFFELDGSSQPIDLQFGVRLVAPGLVGQGRSYDARPLGMRDGTPGRETEAFDAALAAANVSETMSIELQAANVPPVGPTVDVRAPDGDDALMLEVPDAGPQWEHLVLSVDEGGALRWNLPLTDDNQVATPTVRGAGARKRFRIPRTAAPTPPPEVAATRSILGAVGRKLLKVLVYPVTDPILGPVTEFFAGKWEAAKRPYGVRLMTPDNYAVAGAPELTPDDWRRLGEGRALLMIHGTFSSAHGAFGGLARDDMEALSASYGGRVFAFNHFTMSHGPKANVAELVKRIPPDVRLDVDIVCHSRGGLVTRELVERAGAYGLSADRLRVGKAVFVAVPNSGTALANPDHMVHMIDRLTSITNVLPTGPVTEFLEALITVVKVVGHGGLKSLEGLASMRPDGDYLHDLAHSASGRADYYAIAADFEARDLPETASLTALLGDAVMDRVFEDKANDLVVPTEGVYSANGSPCFPIAEVERLVLATSAGVAHTRYFLNPDTRRKLREWLAGGTPVASLRSGIDQQGETTRV